MHCIFCCNGFGSQDLPNRALSYAHSVGLLDQLDSGEEESYLHDRPPHYVAQLLDGALSGDIVDVHDERLKTVTVFKEVE